MSESSSMIFANASKSFLRMALRQISSLRGVSATRAFCNGLVPAMAWPSVEPVFLCDALTIAMQSTSAQCSGGAIETATQSSSPVPIIHSTNPLGMERDAEPEPRRASLDNCPSDRVKPAAREDASASAAKAAAEEAIPAPAGKLFALETSARSLIFAIPRTRSRM